MGLTMLPLPVVLDGIMLWVRCHKGRLKTGQCEGVNIAMNLDVNVCDVQNGKDAVRSKGTDHIRSEKNDLTCCTKSDILALHNR